VTVPLLELLRRRWWLLLVGLVPTVLVALANVSGQPTVYESTSTFVVRPVQADPEQIMRAMDTLLRGVEINTTYANVVSSRLVRARALDGLELTADERAGLAATGQVVTGTSILEIRVTAAAPEVARDYAAAVAAETLTYINELENGFGLVPLDAPSMPGSPSGPGALLAVTVSVLLGTALGVGLVFASGQVLPLGGRRRFNIVDTATGAYTRAFFEQRLREEVARIDRAGGVLKVALLVRTRSGRLRRLFPRLQTSSGLSRTAALLQSQLREADVLAHLGGGRFAVLALDRIAPELGSQLSSVHPKLDFLMSETAYMGDLDRERGGFEDPVLLLERLEKGLMHAADRGDEPMMAASVSR
jgi:capsular polysaccharide biosynthesis protein